MSDSEPTPAELAASRTRDAINSCIDGGQSFLVEAGAGAGKTFSLIEALKYVIAQNGNDLLRRRRQVACITFTKVATEEIVSRTDGHPAIHASTIHAFCWSLLQGFQPRLRAEVVKLTGWGKLLAEGGKVEGQKVGYDEFGRRGLNEDAISLHHDDVLALMVVFLKEEKFRRVIHNLYPVLFVDEYQDTETELAAALLENFIGKTDSPVLGFFGDHWQKIYGEGCGEIVHKGLKTIGKESNFRSVPAIVDCLNRMRPALKQHVSDLDAKGSVAVYHTNSWVGTRRTGSHWAGDLPADASHDYLTRLKEMIAAEGWDLAPSKTKILMLTHKVLATEQGYVNLANAFTYNDPWVKKGDPHIAFFVDIVEPVCIAYQQKKFGEMFKLLGMRTPRVVSHDDKVAWAKDMSALLELREKGTVGQVIELLKQTRRPRLSEGAENRDKELQLADRKEIEETSRITSLRKLREVPYSEVSRLAEFIDDNTLFSTKHGVKGAEFENVLVVCGRGWNEYNFNRFLEEAVRPPSDPKGKEAFERNRNLFYVACSRPKKRLAVLFTQELSSSALGTLRSWFGSDAVKGL